MSCLKAENTQTRRVADFDVANILDSNGRAVYAGDDDFADIVRESLPGQSAHVIELPALRIEAAAGVGIVGVERVKHLHDGR